MGQQRMKILGLVDVHSRLEKLEELLWEAEDVDVVLLGGDITNFGRKEASEAVIIPLLERAPCLFGVIGNCDYPEVEESLITHDCHLEGKPRQIGGIGIIGVGGSLPCPTQTPYERSEQELEGALTRQLAALTRKESLVAVVHQPPLNTALDKALLGGHVGSQAVRAFIEECEPILFFSGHIHESQAIQQIGKTTLVNPGPFMKGNYFVAEIIGNEVSVELRKI
ncbi:MAG: metallophosphoesterase family protein [Bdellovibrionota bacterium]